MSTRPRRSVAVRLEELFRRGGYLAVRPPEILANLAPRYRWEFTRRPPYYLVAWQDVRRRRRGEPADHFLDALTGLVGEAALLAIGVSGVPVDPALEFDDPACGGNDPLLISGACQPVTLRALAILLMQALPPADRAVVGAMLTASGTGEYRNVSTDRSWQAQGVQQLRQLPSEALNSYPLLPLFHLHLGSSQRTILEDVTTQLQLRQKGQTTARAGRRQISTAHDRYRRAFELITGHPYSFNLWFGLFGFLRLCVPLGAEDSPHFGVAHYQRRPTPPPDAAEPPSTPDLSRNVAAERDRRPEIPAGYGLTDLVADVRDLFAAGHSDKEIAARLGVSDLGLVSEVRQRLNDERELTD